MAWRIHQQVVRAVIDSRTKGKVTGTVWLVDRTEALQLELEGNPWPDLAGRLLTLSNPAPQPDSLEGLATEQRGLCGDMTASRKVKIPTVDLRTWLKEHPKEPFPFVWGNSVYLEWYSERNGRVVVESHDYQVTISEPVWQMTAQDETLQYERSAAAMANFMRRLGEAYRDEAPIPAPVPVSSETNPESEAAATQVLDQVSRIEDLKERVRQIAGGEMSCGQGGPVPLNLQEQFWKNVLDYETAPVKTPRQALADAGIQAPPPETLSDPDLTKRLWKIIRGLARHGTYLEETDHLSDRELYTRLIEHVLDEPSQDLPGDSGWACHIAVSEFGSPDDPDGSRTHLRYYADALAREVWASDFPEDEIPPHEDPPYNRDARLPKPHSQH